MSKLLFVLSFALCFAANAQHYETPHAVPADKLESDPYEKVLIMGEAEARAATLRPPVKVSDAMRYLEFIDKVAESYTASIGLTHTESGLLIRALNALGPEAPTKYEVHFKLEEWFSSNMDAKRLTAWKNLKVYPEYLYSYLLSGSEEGRK